MEKNNIIEVRDLVVGYGADTVLENISFDVEEGEIFIVLGGSGCGKSTLLKHLIGLIKPISGRIGSMTIAENVSLPIKEYTDLSHKSLETLVKMKLKMVNLNGYENHLPSEISGGMRKRAGLARAMALNPKILFFDEPSAGLDPVSSVELDNLIIHLNKSLGTTMVIVTHELQSIFNVAHRVIMLDNKTKGIIAEGNPKYLKDHSDDPFVRNFFNRKSEH